MGMKRERFCVFERIFTTANSGGPEQGWSASARCLAEAARAMISCSSGSIRTGNNARDDQRFRISTT